MMFRVWLSEFSTLKMEARIWNLYQGESSSFLRVWGLRHFRHLRSLWLPPLHFLPSFGLLYYLLNIRIYKYIYAKATSQHFAHSPFLHSPALFRDFVGLWGLGFLKQSILGFTDQQSKEILRIKIPTCAPSVKESSKHQLTKVVGFHTKDRNHLFGKSGWSSSWILVQCTRNLNLPIASGNFYDLWTTTSEEQKYCPSCFGQTDGLEQLLPCKP